MTWLWGIAAVLVLWAGIAAVRLRRETSHQAGQAGQVRHGTKPRRETNDEIDRAALEEAEREVKDRDAFQRPDDGFTGDDWGVGSPKR